MCQHKWLLWVVPVGGAWQQLQLLGRPCHVLMTSHTGLVFPAPPAHPVSCQASTRYPHLVPSPSTARSGPPPWLSSDMCPADPCIKQPSPAQQDRVRVSTRRPGVRICTDVGDGPGPRPTCICHLHLLAAAA